MYSPIPIWEVATDLSWNLLIQLLATTPHPLQLYKLEELLEIIVCKQIYYQVLNLIPKVM